MYYAIIGLIVIVLIIIKMSNKSSSSVKHLNSDEFKSNMSEGTILDVRTKREYKTGHLNNSICIPTNVLSDNLNKLDLSKPVFVYCASGARSSSVAGYLLKNGFEVYNLRGGINRWTGKVTKK